MDKLKFKATDNAKDENQLQRQEEIQGDRNRKDQKKTCIQESYPDQENNEAET